MVVTSHVMTNTDYKTTGTSGLTGTAHPNYSTKAHK